jgi:NDP-sugar pyrophosphorylase family protein
MKHPGDKELITKARLEQVLRKAIVNSVMHRDCVMTDLSSSIQNSCIGRNCKIGSNVTITNSIVFNNVSISDNVKIVNSIICSRAWIGQGNTLKEAKIGHSANVQDATTDKQVKDLILSRDRSDS